MSQTHSCPEPDRGYLYGVCIPALCSVVLSSVYSWSQYNPEYRSEYFTAEWVVEMDILMSIANAIVVCLLGFILFLNRSVRIASSFLLSACFWIGLPGIWICYLLLKDHSVFVLINTLPYLVGLTLSFWKFRKTLQS